MTARLHTETVSHGAAAAPAPGKWLLLTHGFLGSGGNWRGIARKLVDRRPDWGVVLVDLRQHGRSEPGDDPPTLDACARDLLPLWKEFAIAAIAGHSFGGKVVLATRALAPASLRQTWMLDASPSAHPDLRRNPANTVVRVLGELDRLPKSWPKREAFVAAIVAAGFEQGFAQWLAMNVVAQPGGDYALRLDLAAMHAMLDDYYARDLWSVLRAPAPGEIEIAIASRGSALSADDQLQLEGAPPHVHAHRITSGHWLNLDAPEAVVALFTELLPR